MNQVSQFLEDVSIKSEEQYEVIVTLRNFIKNLMPEIKEEIKYGGIVFFNDGNLINGLFIRKNHISLEFSYGYLFDDNKGHLEGNGKYRRHIKLKNGKDINEKDVMHYIELSFGK